MDLAVGKIESTLAILNGAVESTLARGTLESKPRSGRPRSTSSTLDHAITLTVKKRRRDALSSTKTCINSALADSTSKSTVYNRIHEAGFDSFVCVKKPQIHPENIAKRLQSAKDHVDWTLEDWFKVYVTNK